MDCPDCDKGLVDGIVCATCEPEFVAWLLPDGRMRVVRSDLPGIADEDAYAITLTADDLQRLWLEARIAELGGVDRTGDL